MKCHVSGRNGCCDVTKSRSFNPHPWSAPVHSISEKARIPNQWTGDVYDRWRRYLIFVDVLHERQRIQLGASDFAIPPPREVLTPIRRFDWYGARVRCVMICIGQLPGLSTPFRIPLNDSSLSCADSGNADAFILPRGCMKSRPGMLSAIIEQPNPLSADAERSRRNGPTAWN